MICPHCDQQHPDEAKFCPNTGLLLPNKNPWRIYAIIVSVVAGLLLIVVGIGLLNRNLLQPVTAQPPTVVVGTTTIAARTVIAPTSTIVTATAARAAAVAATSTIRPPTSTPLPTPTFTPPDIPRGRIVFTCYDSSVQRDQLCAINPDGRNRLRLTNNDVANWFASFSADGNFILFARQISGANHEIFRMNSDGNNVIQLTSNGGGNFAPNYSPDGRRIAFTSDYQIWVMDNNGSNRRALTQGINPLWSPDGKYISFLSAQSGKTQLWVMNTDGSNQQQFTNFDDIESGGGAWSPDGSTLIFHTGRLADKNRKVYLIRRDGSDLHELLLGGDALTPSFSPDGKWIVFTSYRDGNNEIYTARADGTEVTNLTRTDSPEYQPTWGR